MSTIICDIDGTLLSSGAKPIKKTVDWINSHQSYKIALVTGRPQSDRAKTISELKSAGIKYDSLTMNPGSSSQTASYKQRIASSMDDVVLAIDNNPTMRAAYKKAGVKKVVSPESLSPTTLNKNFWTINGKN
jgi:ribonucleotide monophosphatase NagD (HAD superfamily)